MNTAMIEKILIDPLHQGSDHLIIVAGYASPSMLIWHLEELAERGLCAPSIDLIIGMAKAEGLSSGAHELFKKFSKDRSKRFSCKYVVNGPPVHSKVYVWQSAGRPIIAYTGSANYSTMAFSDGRREYMQICNHDEANSYCDEIIKDAVDCDDNVASKISLFKIGTIVRAKQLGNTSKGTIDELTLELLTSDGRVGFGSGINWGIRKNKIKREPNQAYIPLPIKKMKTGFFPLGIHFTVTTDDGISMIMKTEQANNKAITTPLDNSELGKYLRKRIGVPSGEFVSKQDLLRYGRTDVTFRKISEDEFLLDFSI